MNKTILLLILSMVLCLGMVSAADWYTDDPDCDGVSVCDYIGEECNVDYCGDEGCDCWWHTSVYDVGNSCCGGDHYGPLTGPAGCYGTEVEDCGTVSELDCNGDYFMCTGQQCYMCEDWSGSICSRNNFAGYCNGFIGCDGTEIEDCSALTEEDCKGDYYSCSGQPNECYSCDGWNVDTCTQDAYAGMCNFLGCDGTEVESCSTLNETQCNGNYFAQDYGAKYNSCNYWSGTECSGYTFAGYCSGSDCSGTYIADCGEVNEITCNSGDYFTCSGDDCYKCNSWGTVDEINYLCWSGLPIGNCSSYVPIEPLDCGSTITEDTVLNADLTDCVMHGLYIGANDITLDCNGHSIIGSFEASSTGIDMNYYNGITIKNCTIKHFATGVYGNGVVDISLLDNTIVYNNASSGGPETGIHIENGNNATISNNNLSYNAGEGLFFSGNNSLISNNTANYNQNNGIVIAELGRHYDPFYFIYSTNNTLLDNTANENTQYGIFVLATYNLTMKRNTANFNGNNGFNLYEIGNDSVIEDNTADFNEEIGIYLAGVTGMTFKFNTASCNNGYGVQVFSDATVTSDWYDTTACYNNRAEDNGIYDIENNYNFEGGSIFHGTETCDTSVPNNLCDIPCCGNGVCDFCGYPDLVETYFNCPQDCPGTVGERCNSDRDCGTGYVCQGGAGPPTGQAIADVTGLPTLGSGGTCVYQSVGSGPEFGNTGALLVVLAVIAVALLLLRKKK
jgi:parallel beta-helix repeat protein